MKSRIDPAGFYRIRSIVRPRAKQRDENDPAPLFEMSAASWWAKLKRGEVPQPVKVGGMTFWKGSDLLEFSARLGGE